MFVARHKSLLAIWPVVALLSCSTFSKRPVNAESESLASQKQLNEEGIVPPEVVRCTNVRISDGLKTLTMSDDHGEYLLSCRVKAEAGCVTPEPGKNYLLINKTTRWKLPGAQDFITLESVQRWTVTYDQAENIALVPQKHSPSFQLGLYMLDSWHGTH